MCALAQHLLERLFLIENPAGSEIFSSQESPLSSLTEVTVRRRLDQCMLGACLEGQPIRKSTELLANRPIGEDIKCSGGHTHCQLRGHGPGGLRTAQAAMYPQAL